MKKTAILAICAMFAYGCSPKADDSQQNMNKPAAPTQTAPKDDKTCPPKPTGNGCCEVEKPASEAQTASN